jgi:hypothetical protein
LYSRFPLQPPGEIGAPNLCDFDEPVRLCGDNVHVDESRRGYLGSGNVDFSTVLSRARRMRLYRHFPQPKTDNRDLVRHAKEFIDRPRAPS